MTRSPPPNHGTMCPPGDEVYSSTPAFVGSVDEFEAWLDDQLEAELARVKTIKP